MDSKELYAHVWPPGTEPDLNSRGQARIYVMLIKLLYYVD